MASKFLTWTPKFKIKDENFNECASISTISSIKYLEIKDDSSDSDTDTYFWWWLQINKLTSTISSNDKETLHW